MNKIELTNFTDEEDNYELMYKWCSKKIIYKWFEQRILSKDEIKNKYKDKLLRKEQHLFFINYKGVKIGFVQIYQYPKDLDFPVLENYSNIYEYDIFIGDIDYVSKG